MTDTNPTEIPAPNGVSAGETVDETANQTDDETETELAPAQLELQDEIKSIRSIGEDE